MRYILSALALLLLSQSGRAQGLTAYEFSVLDQRYGFSELGITGTVIIVNTLPPDRVVGEGLTKLTIFDGDTTGTWNNLTESDPMWNDEKTNYATIIFSDARYYLASNPQSYISSNQVYNNFYLQSNPSNFATLGFVTNNGFYTNFLYTNGLTIPDYKVITNRSTIQTNLIYVRYGLVVSNAVFE